MRAIDRWAVAAAVLACGCDRGAEMPPAEEAPPAAAEQSAGEVFVDRIPDGAQVLGVGTDSSLAARTDVFVPFSTFAEERDGIPNEFPPPDTIVARLRAAGVTGAPVVIVGEPIPAGRAFAAFDYLGLGDRAVLLNGGVAALAARPAASSASTVAMQELSPDVNDDMIVDAEWVHARLDDPGVAILDARPPAEFSGETPGEGVARPGHIPGARNLFWQTLVQSTEQPVLKDEAELRRMFEAAGAAPGDTVVAYCRTGGQASFLYAVARHLGYETRLYDGSFVDWSRTQYPVER